MILDLKNLSEVLVIPPWKRENGIGKEREMNYEEKRLRDEQSFIDRLKS